MLTADKSPTAASETGKRSELTTAELLDRLRQHASKPLIFMYEGRDVRPGYHVTEVKSGRFEGLDCGANEESWRETFIQLWNVPGEPDRTWMLSGKFLAIIGKVADAMELGEKLTFEVSDGATAMQLYRADAVRAEGGALRVELSRRPSSCKPRDRWLEQKSQSRSACKPANEGASCCG